MVIDNLDLERVRSLPSKADPPLLVDSNAVLPGAIAFQRFQAIARRHAQVIEAPGLIQQQELAPSHALNPGRESPRRLILEQALGLHAGEASYHLENYNASRHSRNS